MLCAAQLSSVFIFFAIAIGCAVVVTFLISRIRSPKAQHGVTFGVGLGLLDFVSDLLFTLCELQCKPLLQLCPCRSTAPAFSLLL